MADPTDEQPAQDGDGRPDEPRPVFDFKLRLGTRESTAALADHATGELVQLQPIEWEPLVGVRSDEDERSYQTDSELQSIIVELANKIAAPDAGRSTPAAASPAASTPAEASPELRPAPVVAELPAVTLRPMFRPESLPDTAAAAPAAAETPAAPVVRIPVISWSPVPEPAPVPTVDVPAAVRVAEPVESEPVESEPAESEPAESEPAELEPADSEPVESEPAESAPVGAEPEPSPVDPAPVELAASESPPVEQAPSEYTAPAARIYGLGDSHAVPVTPAAPHPVAAPGAPPPATPVASAAPYPASGPVAMTPITPIPPLGGQTMASSVPQVAPPPMPPRQPVPNMVGQPLQLAKVERRPDAGRSTRPVDFRDLLGEHGLHPTAVKKRKKRHPFRVLFKLLVVLGIVGAGLFFGKKYVLDMRWASDVEPYAEQLAEIRGLDWERAVKVETLPLADYASRLAATRLGVDDAGLQAWTLEWRAMGLVAPMGDLDLTSIGAAALSERPAFYDPSSKRVFVVDDATGPLRDLAIHHALATALLDQHFHWSSAIADADPGVRLAITTLVDGDATSLAAAALNPAIATTEAFLTQQADLAQLASSLVTAAPPYAVDLVAGSPASAPRFTALAAPADRDVLFTSWPLSDAAVFDGVRSLGEAPMAIGAGPSRGMMYWYYVLAGALPEADAWAAALAWSGDVVTESANCVTANVSTVDEAGRQRLLDAFGRWQTALGRTDVQVTQTTERITVMACDPLLAPGIDVATLPQPSADIVPFGRSAAELAPIGTLRLADATSQSCVVHAVRAFDIVPMIRQGVSAELDQVLADIESSCVAVAPAAGAAPPTTAVGG